MTEFIQLLPQDEHNEQLEANVHPPDWTNPTPSGRYNLVVIGAGTAGLVAAAGAAAPGVAPDAVLPGLVLASVMPSDTAPRPACQAL